MLSWILLGIIAVAIIIVLSLIEDDSLDWFSSDNDDSTFF